MSWFFKKIGMRTNIIAYPSIQTRYSLLVAFIAFLQGAVIIVLSEMERQKIRTYSELDLLGSSTLYFQLMALLVGTAFSFVVAFGVLHRFLGPLLPIIRYFEELKAGKKDAKLFARKEDALTPLVDYLKTVDIEVREKK